MQQQLFHSLRNAKQLNIGNITKVNRIHDTKLEKKLRNETKFYLSRNETKGNKISLFLCFAKQAKFRETAFLFRFVSCFAKQKKGCERETLRKTLGN
jgi:hypothetical protein